MIMKILTFPDPRLREVADSVKPSEFGTPELKQLQEDMIETMYDAHGIGLAAPQVGELRRMIVIDTRPKDDKGRRYKDQEMTELEQAVEQPLVLINPEIIKGEGKTTFDEGCLSVPGYYETVERYDYIEMRAYDVNGKEFVVKVDGLLAICMQHELDHLEGTLFIDHLSFVKSNKIKKQIQKHGYPTREQMEKARAKELEGEERE
ncbi:peptide deformylase [Bdellovibrio sp. HCB274]|uniref:peptide deformylase n=1 Tax=Bdellovibrio sp. HCB274 TaxID=3394361 RepID=UPI0039B37084